MEYNNYMETVRTLIRNKPKVFVVVSFVYFLLVALMKWNIHPDVSALWFFLGGAIGIYFMDGAELFFHLTPSPFSSVMFCALFTVVSLFVATSSGNALATGLVLSLYIQMIQRQIGEWRVTGNLSSWFRMVHTQVPVTTQRMLFGIFTIVFLIETIFFIRSL